MLTRLQHTTPVKPHPLASLEALLDEPFLQSPEALWHLEQRLSPASAQAADQILLVQLTRAHEDATFVAQAITRARQQRPVALVHQGLRTTRVLLSGGTRIVSDTPYLREDRRRRRGRRRGTRGA
jgi:hypothetical protein